MYNMFPSPLLDLQKIDFLSILNRMDDGVIIADRNGVILFYNNSQAKIDGISPKEAIGSMVIGGQYLTHPKTFKLCRTEFYMPALMARANHERWDKGGRKTIDVIAEDKVAQRLASYEKPDIDPDIEKALIKYVGDHKTAMV